MSELRGFDITDDGGIELWAETADGNRRTVTLDSGVADENLDLRARSTVAFDIEFPDGEGGRLIIAFILDLSVPELQVWAGRPGNLVQLVALSP